MRIRSLFCWTFPIPLQSISIAMRLVQYPERSCLLPVSPEKNAISVSPPRLAPSSLPCPRCMTEVMQRPHSPSNPRSFPWCRRENLAPSSPLSSRSPYRSLHLRILGALITRPRPPPRKEWNRKRDNLLNPRESRPHNKGPSLRRSDWLPGEFSNRAPERFPEGSVPEAGNEWFFLVLPPSIWALMLSLQKSLIDGKLFQIIILLYFIFSVWKRKWLLVFPLLFWTPRTFPAASVRRPVSGSCWCSLLSR